jgi:hypothetical protein
VTEALALRAEGGGEALGHPGGFDAFLLFGCLGDAILISGGGVGRAGIGIVAGRFFGQIFGLILIRGGEFGDFDRGFVFGFVLGFLVGIFFGIFFGLVLGFLVGLFFRFVGLVFGFVFGFGIDQDSTGIGAGEELLLFEFIDTVEELFDGFFCGFFEGVFVEGVRIGLLVGVRVFDRGRGLFAVLGEGFAGEQDDVAGGGGGHGKGRGFIGFGFAGFAGIEGIAGAGVLGVGESVFGATAAAGAAATAVPPRVGVVVGGPGFTGGREGFRGFDWGGRGRLQSGCRGAAGFAGVAGVAASVAIAASTAATASVAIPIPVAITAAAIGGGGGGRILDFLYVFAVLVEEVGDIEKGIAFEAEVDEGRLHARQDAGDSSFVDTACQRIFVGTLKMHLDELTVFEDGDFGLVARLADHQFLGWHQTNLHYGERSPGGAFVRAVLPEADGGRPGSTSQVDCLGGLRNW